MKTAALVLVVLLGCPAVVVAQMDCDDQYENLHWSQDGRFLTYKRVSGSTEGPIDTSDVVVYDLAAGEKTEEFVVAAEPHCWDGGSGECDRELRKLTREATKMAREGQQQWRTWLAANALVEATAGNRSPDGKLRASLWIALRTEGIDAVIAIRRDRQHYVCKRAALNGGLESWLQSTGSSAESEVSELYWSPNGQYVALKILGGCDGHSMIAVCKVADATQRATTVEIRKAGGYGDDAPALLDILAKNGFGLVRLMQAQSRRDRTTIYTKQTSSAQAKKLAGIVPGGAVVEKLTWASPADFVLALGDSFSSAGK